METLYSNTSKNEKWFGADPHLLYPSVSTCITVTCSTADTLLGMHLMYQTPSTQMEKHMQELRAFLKKHAEVRSVYVVGFFDEWIGMKNRTGFTVSPTGEGTLLEAIQQLTGYRGLSKTYNVRGKTVNIEARLAGEGASITVGGTPLTEMDYTTVQTTIPVIVTHGSGQKCCVIL